MWAVLSVILCLSCMKINCKTFVTIACFTVVIGYMLEDKTSSVPRAREDDREEQQQVEASARAGEMYPNPRLQERPDSPEKINHGHESFRHLVKPEKKSQENRLQAFIRDAVDNGFRP